MKSRRMKLVGHVARIGEGRGVYKVLVEKPDGKKPLGIPMRRWEENIKADLQEAGCEGMDWNEVALDRDTWWALMNRLASQEGLCSIE
jgi:hypothetical protein